MGKLFGKGPVDAKVSTLRTVEPVQTSDKKPATTINVIKLIDENVPQLIRESEDLLTFYTAEVARLKLYITGLKEVSEVMKKHELTIIGKPTDKK